MLVTRDTGNVVYGLIYYAHSNSINEKRRVVSGADASYMEGQQLEQAAMYQLMNTAGASMD